MPSPLIEKLISEHGYPLIGAANLEDFIGGDETSVLFLTGDPAKNLETDDVAVILPELARAFGHRFKPGVVDRSIEKHVRERFDVWPVPSLLFVRRGQLVGAIPKVRDWEDYLTEIKRILNDPHKLSAA